MGLETFSQNDEGDIIFERMSREGPRRYSGYSQESQSMRLAGGTMSLITALSDKLTQSNIQLGMRITQATLKDSKVTLKAVNLTGSEQEIEADYVIFALPPRPLEATVSFNPELDSLTKSLWQNTPTWMAPHAKFFAVYEKPFWREAGLSGTAQSMVGPLVEIHDATTASGKAALFGFLGVAAEQRAKIGEKAITEACVQQLVRLFGPGAGNPSATIFKDWAADSYTATTLDQSGGEHPEASSKMWVTGIWQNRIFLAASETSPLEPGYLAGAIHAAKQTVDIIRDKSGVASDDRA